MQKILKFRTIKDGELHEIDEQITKMSDIIRDSPSLEEEIEINTDKGTFLTAIKFYQEYDFDIEKLEKINKEFISDVLEDNIGKKNIEILNNYISQDGLKVNEEKLKPLLDLCMAYNFKYLKDVCLLAIGTFFYCEPTEEGLEKLKKKFNIGDISDEEMYNIMAENEDAFTELNAEFIKALNNVQEDDL